MAKNKEVDDWLKKYDNPMKATVCKMRESILNAGSRISWIPRYFRGRCEGRQFNEDRECRKSQG